MANLDIINIGVDLLHKIESLGNYEAFIVGGTPRDLILGENVHDVDISTNCPINILQDTFNIFDIGKSKDFGIVVIHYKGIDFEVAQFRADGSYTDGRRPNSVECDVDFFTDTCRRDFTCNAIGMTKEGNFIDYHNGQKDITDKVLRSVGNSEERFLEDYLRMMRAARFLAALNFNPDTTLRRAIKKHSKLINVVAKERVSSELLKAAEKGGKTFASFINWLHKLRLLSKILPEIDSLCYFKHRLDYHPEGITVYEHVIKSLEACNSNDPTILMAVLLHDVGKAPAFGEKNGYPTYYEHEILGMPLVEEVGKRLKLSNDMMDIIKFTTKNHMRVHRLGKMKTSKVVKLVNNPFWKHLVEVAYADDSSRGPEFSMDKFNSIINNAEEVSEKYKNNFNNNQINIVSGKVIMRITGLKSGVLIGNIKKAVQDRLINENLDNDKKTIKRLVLEEYEKIK